MKSKRSFSSLIIFLISIGLFLNLTACKDANVSMTEHAEVQEGEKLSNTDEPSDLKSPEKEEEKKPLETETKETEERLSDKIARSQAEKYENRGKEVEDHWAKELEARKKRQEKMTEARKSLGKLYPKNTLTWNGITLSYQPLSERPELAFDSEMSAAERYEILDGQEYDIWEVGTEFDAKDNQLTWFTGHNREDAFAPFWHMKLGDFVYVTGKDGETYEYIVVDLALNDLSDPYSTALFKEEAPILLKVYASNNLLYKGLDQETIVINFCRDDEMMNVYLAIPTSDYEILKAEKEAESK
ncbi:MAG: hypothetical protein Q4P08_03795 [Eubacteriales bacterium]|nr:hypothetical protein [Eubacteriales bacterium]